jgi:simple sugar transport system permease protein
VPASVFFGGLLVGAQRMQRELGVSASLITAINGLVVVFVVSAEFFILRRARRRVSGGTPEQPLPEYVGSDETVSEQANAQQGVQPT